MENDLENIIYNLEYQTEININVDEMESIRDEQKSYVINNKNLSVEEKMKRIHIIGLTYFRENNYEENIKYATEVNLYATEINDEYYKAKSYGWISIDSLILKKFGETRKYYNMAEQIFIKLNKYEDIALLTARMAINVFKSGYSKEELRISLDKAISFTHKFKTALSAQIYMTIASLYSIGLNNFDIAIDIYSDALEIAREYELVDIEALVLYYIGVGYFELNMNQKAIEIYNNILNEEKFKDKHSIRAFVSLDLMATHIDNKIELGKVNGIIDISEEAISKLDYLKKEQYNTILNLFKIKYYISINKLNIKEMIVLLNEAKAIYEKYGTCFIFSHVDYWLNQLFGIMYLKLGEYNKAIESHQTALYLSNNYETRYTIESYEDLSRVYEEVGEYEKALYYTKKANEAYKNLEYSDLIKKYLVTHTNYEKLKESEKERNEFFITLSHELKTPINIMYSSLQLLSLFKDKNDKEFKEYYLKHEQSVKQNCLRMLRLIHNLIDITKINTGAIKPNFVNYNIVELVEEVTMSVSSSLEIKGIDIVFDTYIEENIVKCDPYMIERIMLNLLSNAIKFSPSDSQITVNLEGKNEYILIRVKDNGIGIPFHMKKKIFEKFQQIDKSLNRKAEGSGIGLSIVKLLVDLHFGYIEVYSEEGVGSEFIVHIPNKEIDEISRSIQAEKYNVQDEIVSMELSDIYG